MTKEEMAKFLSAHRKTMAAKEYTAYQKTEESTQEAKITLAQDSDWKKLPPEVLKEKPASFWEGLSPEAYEGIPKKLLDQMVNWQNFQSAHLTDEQKDGAIKYELDEEGMEQLWNNYRQNWVPVFGDIWGISSKIGAPIEQIDFVVKNWRSYV